MFSVFNAAEGTTQPNRVKPVRRRDKPQLSCTSCRQKKLKCDRMKPCLNCSRRGQPESCDYVKHPSSNCPPAGQHAPTDFHHRVRQLEQVVKNLVENQNPTKSIESTRGTSPSLSGSIDSGKDEASSHSTSLSPPSQINVDVHKVPPHDSSRTKDRIRFVGNEHWESVLEDITDLRIDLESAESGEIGCEPQILFGRNHVSKSEILASVPPKPVCDKLISRWSRTMDMAPMIIHMPAFMREYNQVFEEQRKPSLMWFGLLFSILSLASLSYAISEEELHDMPGSYTSMWEMSRHFRDRASQTLVTINYLQPRRYTVETLCLYFATEKFQAKSSDHGAYVTFGIIVRVAMRLGYHRDASHYPSISAFDGEMRRRVWTTIFQLDFSTSAQVGLPRMIRDEEVDTAEPRNLLDTDFDECTNELPPPRPSTDVTPVTFSIHMLRLSRCFGLVVDQTNAVIAASYKEIMYLDSKLMTTHATLPSYLSMRPLSHSITDDTDLILRRYALEVCFQKSRCVLHRKYLLPNRSKTEFHYSRTASVDAAMSLLTVQRSFHEGIQPDGQLSSQKWRSNALINQDYVLATMILYLDLSLNQGSSTNIIHGQADEIEMIWPRNDRLDALRYSYKIFCASSESSALACKAAKALKVMLNGLEVAKSLMDQNETEPLSLNQSHATQERTTNSAQENPIPSDTFNFNAYTFGVMPPVELPTGTADTNMNFDWNLWDSQFQTVPMDLDDLYHINYD